MSRKAHQSKKKIPQFLQPILWSVRVDHLDPEEDKTYIINQVLAFGGWDHLKWLFKTYPKKTIKKVFINDPLKIYTSSAFNFAKEILLELGGKKLDLANYDRDLPRVIRR